MRTESDFFITQLRAAPCHPQAKKRLLGPAACTRFVILLKANATKSRTFGTGFLFAVSVKNGHHKRAISKASLSVCMYTYSCATGDNAICDAAVFYCKRSSRTVFFFNGVHLQAETVVDELGTVFL